MPLEQCSKGGKKGWRWGNKGACYIGPNAKKLALKQGYAEGPDKFKEEVSKGHISFREAEEVVREIRAEKQEKTAAGSDFMGSVEAYISKKQRDKISDEDFGWPEEKKYPVRNQEELDAAAKLIGRAPADKQGAIKARIKKIAKKKGLKLPESWGD